MGQLGDGARRGVGHRDPLGALFSFIGMRVRRGGQWLEPTPRVGRRRDEHDGAHTRLAGRPKVWTVAVEAVRHNILERQYPRLVEFLDHRGSQLGFALPHHRVWQLALSPPGGVGVEKPRLWQEQPFVDQGITLARRIGRKHPDLTVLDLPQRSAVLAGHTYGVLPFFRKPCLIDDQHAIGLAHLVLDQAMIRLQHGRFVPERVTDEPLHRSDLATFHLQGHRFDRFAFERAELPHHIIEKLVPRCLPGKTRAKGGVEPTEFVHKRVDIAPSERTLGNGKRLVCRPTHR